MGDGEGIMCLRKWEGGYVNRHLRPFVLLENVCVAVSSSREG